MFKVDQVIGANVESGDKSYPVKTVLPVPAGSADVDLTDSGPGQGRRAKQKEVLGDYAKDLHRLMPDEGLTLSTAWSILQGMPGLVDTMDTYGPARAGRYVSFFEIVSEPVQDYRQWPGHQSLQSSAASTTAITSKKQY